MKYLKELLLTRLRRRCLFVVFTLNVLSIYSQSSSIKWVSPIQSGLEVYSTAIATDGEGNTYGLGAFEFDADFNPDPNPDSTYILDSDGMEDIFIVSLNPDGKFRWARKIGGTGFEMARSIRVDKNNDIIICGTFSNTVNFGTDAQPYKRTAVGETDIFILKMNSSGKVLWVRDAGSDYEDYATAVDVDLSGNIYVAGSFKYTMDADPGAAVSNLKSNGKEDVFIISLDSSGKFRWAKNTGGKEEDEASSISVNRFGSVYVLGSFTDKVNLENGQVITGDYSCLFLAEYSGSGKLRKALAWQGFIMTALASKVVCDQEANVYIMSDFSERVDFNPDSLIQENLTAKGSTDMFFIKLDSALNFKWVRNIGGADAHVFGFDMTSDVYGNVYVVGSFSDTVDFDPGSGLNTIASVMGSNMYTIKLNHEGNLVWVSCLGGYSIGIGISIDRFNNINSICNFSGPVEFDIEKPGKFYRESKRYCDVGIFRSGQCEGSSINMDITSCKTYSLNNITYNKTGRYIQRLNNHTGCDSVIVLDLKIANTGYTIEKGKYYMSVNKEDPYAVIKWYKCVNDSMIPLKDIEIGFSGKYRLVIQSGLCSDTSECIEYFTLGLDDKMLRELQVFPNPLTGNEITLSMPEANSTGIIRIMDSHGRTIKYLEADFENPVTIDMGTCSSGIYYINLILDGISYNRKLQISR